MLELDHVFCMVDPAEPWPERLAAGGWTLDSGSAHPAQGTRNRRLSWGEQYLELVWVEDRDRARDNPLRLDRRADWAGTGASPFGVGLRGRLAPRQEPAFWRYTDLGFPIWVHRDGERHPERPLVFVLDLPARRPARPTPGTLREVHHRGPAAPDLPDHVGPPWIHRPGPHRLQLVVDGGSPVEVTDQLAVVRTASLPPATAGR
ncbi:VOC family protein [Geodermatophilus sp. SYSU D00691]